MSSFGDKLKQVSFYKICPNQFLYLKFVYSEKVTKFCQTSTLLLSVCTVDKSKVEISQNFVVFSEYMNFTTNWRILFWLSYTFLIWPLFIG